MIVPPDSLADVSRAIQLALAPVFLLTGIAGILNVTASRVARIVDRGRALTEGRSTLPDMGRLPGELHLLERRRYLASLAITACTIAALLLCMLIVMLFLEVMLDMPLKWLIGGLFAASTLALVVGLSFFLREVHLAMQSIHLHLPDAHDGQAHPVTAGEAAVLPLAQDAEYYMDERCHIIEVSNSDADPAMSIARARVTPGVTTRWHCVHGTVERYVIQSGHGLMEVGDGPPQAVGSGDVVVIPPGVRQRLTNTGGDDLIFLAICTPRFRFEDYEDVDPEPLPG